MTQYLIIKVSSEFVQLYCKRYIFNIKLPLRLIQGTPNSWVAMSAFHLTMLRTILPLLVAVSLSLYRWEFRLTLNVIARILREVVNRVKLGDHYTRRRSRGEVQSRVVVRR